MRGLGCRDQRSGFKVKDRGSRVEELGFGALSFGY